MQKEKYLQFLHRKLKGSQAFRNLQQSCHVGSPFNANICFSYRSSADLSQDDPIKKEKTDGSSTKKVLKRPLNDQHPVSCRG